MNSFFDTELLSSAVPICIGLGWLSIVHLQRRPLCLIVCMLLTVGASPLVISWGWPKAGGILGFGPYDEVGPEPLLPMISVIYVMTVALICFSGGSVGLGITMVLGQALIRVHGIEALGLG